MESTQCFLSILTIFIFISISQNVFAFDHTHAKYQNVLNEYVMQNEAQSLVNYAALKKTPEILSQYLKQLSKIKKEEFSKWTSDQKLATLINAYNAWTLKLIIDHYPVSSIKDIGTWLTSPWKKVFFKWLGDDSYLDFIEHEQIRKDFKEPRIHFALVCASIGCPSLSSKVFLAKTLDAQLEAASSLFLNDQTKNRISSLSPLKLQLSSIFKWYGSDFPDLNLFISKRMTSDPHVAGNIEKGNYKAEYLTYNWDLNDYKPTIKR